MLKTRVLTALVLTPAFIGAIFFLSTTLWALFAMLIAMIGLHEWASLQDYPPKFILIYLLISAALLMLGVLGAVSGLTGLWGYIAFGSLLIATLLWLVAVPFWLITPFKAIQPMAMAGLGWLILVPLFSSMIVLRNIGPWVLLLCMSVVWIADVAAYFAGKKFGQHKLAPHISPGKTWEGVVGAWLAVTVYGLVLNIWLHWNMWFIVAFWAMMILSVMGDLFESLIKRLAGVKDSGSLLPGHGGVLDRIDGLTSVLPVTAFFIHFPLYTAAIHG